MLGDKLIQLSIYFYLIPSPAVDHTRLSRIISIRDWVGMLFTVLKITQLEIYSRIDVDFDGGIFCV